MKGWLSKRVVVLLIAVMSVLMAIVPLGTSASSEPLYSSFAGTNVTSNTSVFYLAVDSYGSFTPNLNPFSGIASEPYETTAISLVYQPLMYLMNGEAPSPALATSYSYSSNLTNITFTLRSNVEYSNGASFGPSDVLFSFNYIMSHPNIDFQELTSFISSINQTGVDQVSFYLTTTAYTNLYAIMSQPIVYPNQFRNVSDPYGLTLTDPIGTGPFVAQSITASQFELSWNSHYYYTGSHISTLIIPSYPSVTAETNALSSGNINWFSGGFDAAAPTWAGQSPNHFYFYPPSGFLMLWINTHAWPLNMSLVRTAMAYVLNRNVLSNESLQPPAANFVEPALSNYLSPSFVTQYPNGSYYNLNLTKATSLMEQAGFTKGSNGYWQYKNNNTEVKVTLSGNGAASNVVANLNTISTEFKSFGIDASVYTPSGAIFYSNIYSGNYSMGMGFLPSTINPIGALQTGFSSTYLKPIGTSATGDYSRYNNTNVTKDLQKAANQTTLDGQRQYIQAALSILLNDTPAIPVAESISQNEFNTYGYAGVNQTTFKDALYSNTYGLISIAVPLTHIYSTTSTSPTGLSLTDYVIIGVVAVVIIAGVAVVALRRNRTKEE
ncbi:antimicrobial peptide ABC transporter periplasmic binding protein SapA [Thermoplasmatales archaeon]|nr:antimicrobial peptide ABC transporter periplasmic binding protein SapA [Thermoplasmatales archaeon]